jgi:hypothetical protein
MPTTVAIAVSISVAVSISIKPAGLKLLEFVRNSSQQRYVELGGDSCGAVKSRIHVLLEIYATNRHYSAN